MHLRAELSNILDRIRNFVCNILQMPAKSEVPSVVDRQLLLQLGARLKQARVRKGLTTTQMAECAGISRMTLSAVEAGEPTPVMGTLNHTAEFSRQDCERDDAERRCNRNGVAQEPDEPKSAKEREGHSRHPEQRF